MRSKIIWKWVLTGALSATFVFHPFVMITDHFMREPLLVHGQSVLDIILQETLMAFTQEMVPWNLSFAILGALVGLFYGRTKQAKKALRESEEKYKIFTESSQSGIYVHQDDKIVFANNRFAELHGYTVQELLNTNYFELFHPSEKKLVQEINFKRLRGEDAPQYHETKKVKKDGGTLWCQTAAAVIEYQGKPAIMGNIVDITDRKKIEEQRDKLILDLQNALSEVKTLSGLLPICSHCKKIRDDKGYWNQIESYIRDRSDAEFSHGICPECAKELYPDIDIYDDNGELTQD